MVFDLVELWVPIWLRLQSATRPSIYLVLPVYDLRRSAAEDIVITHAAAAARNLTQPPHCDLSVPRAAPVAQASLLISPHRNVHSPGKNNVSCKSGRSNLILDVAKHHRIATHYSRLSSLDAAVPMQKVPQHLHPSIAQCQQQHTKSHFETSVTAPSRIRAKAVMPAPVAQASLIFSAPDRQFTCEGILCSSSNAICFISILYSPVRFSAPPYSSLN